MTLAMDLLLIACFLLTLAAGARGGFFRELFALLGVAAGVAAAIKLTEPVLLHLSAGLRGAVSAAIIFMLIVLVAYGLVTMIGVAFSALWEGRNPGGLSRLLGFILGGVRGLLLVLVLAGTLVLLAPDGSVRLGRSRVLPRLGPGITWGAHFLPPDVRAKLLEKWQLLPFGRTTPVHDVRTV